MSKRKATPRAVVRRPCCGATAPLLLLFELGQVRIPHRPKCDGGP